MQVLPGDGDFTVGGASRDLLDRCGRRVEKRRRRPPLERVDGRAGFAVGRLGVGVGLVGPARVAGDPEVGDELLETRYLYRVLEAFLQVPCDGNTLDCPPFRPVVPACDAVGNCGGHEVLEPPADPAFSVVFERTDPLAGRRQRHPGRARVFVARPFGVALREGDGRSVAVVGPVTGHRSPPVSADRRRRVPVPVCPPWCWRCLRTSHMSRSRASSLENPARDLRSGRAG